MRFTSTQTRFNTGSTDPGAASAVKSPEEINFDVAAARNEANAAAETAKAGGLAQEADAYRIAAGIAGTSANLEQTATAITRFQQQRQVKATLAGQRADVASAGFREAGSSISLLRDSISQGAITDALTNIQGQINVGGYRAQQAAAVGEQQAALAGSDAATALAKQYADAGVLATSLSANAAAAARETRIEDLPQIVSLGHYGIPSNAIIRIGGGGGTSSGANVTDTLVNPAYTGLGGGSGIGTGVVPGGGATVNAGTAVPRGPSAGGGGNVATPAGGLLPDLPDAAALANAEGT